MPQLVPDISIFAGDDIVAVEQPTLKLIDREELIPKRSPKAGEFSGDISLLLFERIHAKTHYAVVRFLEELGSGTTAYTLVAIE